MAPGDWLPVQNNGFVFVEGAYSCHPVLGEYMDRKVFLDIDHETQTERIRTRNGEDILQDFLQLWIPLEEAYFQAFSLEENTDYIIKQTKGETDAASVYPDYEADSAYGIDYRTLYEQGYRGIILILTIHSYRTGHRQHRRQQSSSADCGNWDFRHCCYRTTRSPA